jgi:O-antigen/teichoic acid export membrane protein
MTEASSGRSTTAVIARNSAFVMAAQVGMKVLAFLFQVYVVRSLGDVDYGKFATVMAYLGIFAIFSDVGMAPYAVREMAHRWERARTLLPNVIAIRLALSVFVVIAATAGAMLMHYAPDIVLGVFLAACGLFLYAFQGPLDAVMTARERLDYSAVLMILNQVIFVMVGAVMLVAGVGFIGLILATLLGVGVCGGLLWRLARRKLDLRLEKVDVRRWKTLLVAALPFGVHGVAIVLMQRFDTVVLSLTHSGPPTIWPGTPCSVCLHPTAYQIIVSGAQAAGWYAVSLNLTLMVMMIAQSISISMYPTLVREHARDPQAIRGPLQRSIKYLLLMSLPISVGATVLAEPIIVKLYRAEFTPSITVLRIIVWALPLLFISELVGYVALVLQRERGLARRVLLTAGINVALDLALVPTLGLLGASLAFLVARAILTVLHLDLVGVRLVIGRTWPDLLRVVVAAGVMGVGVYLLRDQNLFLAIGAGAAIYAVALLVVGAIRVSEIAQLAAMILRRTQPQRAA